MIFSLKCFFNMSGRAKSNLDIQATTKQLRAAKRETIERPTREDPETQGTRDSIKTIRDSCFSDYYGFISKNVCFLVCFGY